MQRLKPFLRQRPQTLLSVAQAVVDGELPLNEWAEQSAQGQWTVAAVDVVAQRLLAIKGIGPWTVNYCLLRGYGWPDGSLHMVMWRCAGRLACWFIDKA